MYELLFFTSPSCNKCKSYKHIIDMLRDTWKLTITNIDITKVSNLAEKYDIQSLPSFVLLQNNNAVEVMQWEVPLVSMLRKYIPSL